MADRFPDYDVLRKRNSPSWNEATRRVIDQRLTLPRQPRFFTEDEWRTLNAVCDRIVPQPSYRVPIPVPSMIDDKLTRNLTDGYRNSRLPRLQEAWRRGLHALDQEALARHGIRFHALTTNAQDELLTEAQRGELRGEAWEAMPCALFFNERLVHDIVAAYYAHPTAWNEIGFGGPASPRGYVRMGADKRDPW
ncbi:MAG TPA: gluconate 2-dehydrogenase subunit 3 family protein, partial [Acetobacteraceae bacterium]|nr:gluconate 2-dehydrogenase subunit 3 family protein [Acetobacteraceae bacterium]